MHAIQDPGEPEPYVPPREDDDDESNREPSPFERPPFERDPEAQRAPGDGEETGSAPPMQAEPGSDGAAAENLLDGPGVAREPVGNDNIRDGTVGGVMGGPHQSMGQGQGG